MHLLVGFPNPWPAAFRKSVPGFFVHFPKFPSKNVRFGRSLARLILGALSLYPFEVKDGASLAMYPLVSFAFQAQGYVSKGQRFLSDAPIGRFP